MSKTTTEYRFVGSHVDDLANGQLLEPGQTYKLDADQAHDPHNQRHIDEGTLVEVPAKSTRKESD